MITGGCHCGSVRFKGNAQPHPELLECNCSICSLTGYLHLIIRHDDFTLIAGKNALSSYKFGSSQANHLFCRYCGVKSFYQPRSHLDSWSVNFNCLDAGHGLEPTVRKFDGQNWEKAKVELG